MQWIDRRVVVAAFWASGFSAVASGQDVGVSPNPGADGPFSACCLADGSCITVPEDVCAVLQGQFQGGGIDCAIAMCEPFGACCFSDLSCIAYSEEECVAFGGDYLGDGVDCVIGVCPIRGACCLPDGSCSSQTHDDCAAAGGQYQGFLSFCGGVTCTGGCSFDNGSCLDALSADVCTAAGGNPLGPGSTCAATNGPTLVQCRTFSFDQNNVEFLDFDRFDESTGRRLERATVELDGEIVAVVALTNLSEEEVTTEVEVSEALFMFFTALQPTPLVAVDVVDVIECNPPTLPPCDPPICPSCDFGSPLVFPGEVSGAVALPADLGSFIGPGTISAEVNGLGTFTYFGSQFILENNPHRAEGKVRVTYEYVLDCPADFNGTGDVGFGDLLSLLAAWGPCPGCPQDIDASGTVGFNDLVTLLGEWGPCR